MEGQGVQHEQESLVVVICVAYGERRRTWLVVLDFLDFEPSSNDSTATHALRRHRVVAVFANLPAEVARPLKANDLVVNPPRHGDGDGDGDSDDDGDDDMMATGRCGVTTAMMAAACKGRWCLPTPTRAPVVTA